MASSNHHRAGDKLAEGGELSAQGRIHSWVSETQTDVGTVSVRIFDLELSDETYAGQGAY
jgi:hypothetical protein